MFCAIYDLTRLGKEANGFGEGRTLRNLKVENTKKGGKGFLFCFLNPGIGKMQPNSFRNIRSLKDRTMMVTRQIENRLR